MSSVVLRREEKNEESSAVAIHSKYDNKGALVQSVKVKRTSGLHAPIMLLLGHRSAVLTGRFSPCGKYYASGSFDKTIFLWNVYHESCQNYNVLRGHSSAILQLEWSMDSEKIFTASADKSVAVFDALTGERVRRFKGHSSFVNSINGLRLSPWLLVSGSDDKTIHIWDQRQKNPVTVLSQRYAITAVSFSAQGDQIMAGSLDNDVTVWDIRNSNIDYKLQGHTDTITGIRLSPNGSHLLSNSMDNTVKVWDVKPFSANSNRCLRELTGAPHGFENNLLKAAWSPGSGARIAAGSGDRTVMVWDVESSKPIYKLPGHKGCVNEVDFHPKEPIIASCSSDRQIYFGELDPSL